MELQTLFRPLEEQLSPTQMGLDHYQLGHFVSGYRTDHFPNWMIADLIIIGCDEDRGSKEISGSGMAPDLIRQQLYQLSAPRLDLKIADLGNLVKTDTLAQYYDNIALVVHECIKRGKLVILLGGSQDIAYGQYKGYQGLMTSMEYVSIDSRLDVEDSDFGVTNHSYNHKIFLHSPNYLFNFTNLGHQSYFITVADRKRLKNLYFHAIRLGELRENLRIAEPALRNASMVTVDLSSVRSSDAPGSANPSPAGFSTEEICQLMRYAGMANRVNSISFCEAHPMKDFNEQSTLLSAMMIWYFIEGVYNRKDDEPIDPARLTKYRINLHGGTQEIIFYQNDLTGRWWMEVPYPEAIANENGRRKLIPCSKEEYEMAKRDEIPERWWLTHYKLK